jgi:hypothetical protein
VASKPSKAEKQEQGKTGFVVVATRWAIKPLKRLDGTL